MKGGGVLVYVRQDVIAVDKTNSSDDRTGRDVDILSAEITIKRGVKNFKFFLLSVYRPPLIPVELMIEKLEGKLKDVGDGRNIIIMGDFNINYNSANPSSALNKLQLFLNSNGLCQQVNMITRETPYCKSILDLVITNIPEKLQITIDKTTFSDHYTVITHLDIEGNKDQVAKWNFRIMKYYTKRKLQQSMGIETWDYMYNENASVEDKWAYFSHKIKRIVDKLCPYRSSVQGKKKYRWFDAECRQEVHERNLLYKEALNTNDIGKYDMAKKKRKLVKRLFVSKKKKYIEEQLVINRSNSRKFWRTMKTELDTS